MSKQGDLQKLLELAQMDFGIEKKEKTRARIQRDLVRRFAENFVHKNDAEAPGMTLEKLQQHLAPVIAYLRSKDIVADFHFKSRLLRSGGKVISFIHWQDHLLLSFIRLLNNSEENDLQTCPRCGNYFVTAGRKTKRHCTPRCRAASGLG